MLYLLYFLFLAALFIFTAVLIYFCVAVEYRVELREDELKWVI